MQINFQRLLGLYFPRVPIFLAMTVYMYVCACVCVCVCVCVCETLSVKSRLKSQNLVMR